MALEPGGTWKNLLLERELGRGAFGVVYLARDRLLQRPVALKVLLPGTGDARSRILEEARLIGGLNCPHIVTLYAAHRDEEHGLLLEMEFVPGGTLEDRLEPGVALDRSAALTILRGIALALEAAHASRVIHGDIKPANVLFAGDGSVKLADFGIARALDRAGNQVPLGGRVEGSPLYMAPEVITGKHTGIAADIWSATVLLYQLMTGRLPFPAETLPELLEKLREGEPDPLEPGFPEPLVDLLRRGLSSPPEDRPATIWDFLDRLEAVESALGPAEPSRVPAVEGPFLGRESECEKILVRCAMEGSHLMTLTGPVGVGKSRLLLEAGRALGSRHRVFHVAMTGLATGPEVERAVVDATGTPPSALPPDTVLLLDVDESSVPALAQVVSDWLRTCRHCRILVASRVLLEVGGESAIEVPPLAADGPGDAAPTLLAMLHPDLSPEEALTVARKLHGFPLALVAATNGEDPVPAGLRAMCDAATRALENLDGWESCAFRQIGRTDRGMTLEEAEEALDLSEFPDAPLAMDVVQDLRNRSLLSAREEGGETRFAIWPVLRACIPAG